MATATDTDRTRRNGPPRCAEPLPVRAALHPSDHPTLEYFDAVASTYAKNLSVGPDFLERFELFRSRMVEVRDGATTQPPTALDIGCGPGTLAVEAGLLGFRVIGVDGSTRMLELARTAGQERGLDLDLRHATVPLPEDVVREFEGSIDLLVASSVVEYIDDQALFATQCRRLLAPGGTALVSFANRQSVYRWLERRGRSVRGSRRSDHEVARHQHAAAAARELFASAGLRTRSVDYFAMPPAMYRVTRATQRPRWMANLFLLSLEVSGLPRAPDERPRLIVVGPVPPPTHGVTISTALVLANPQLAERFAVEHLDTSDRRSDLSNIGTWDVTNVVLALRSARALLTRLRRGPGLVYLPLSSGVSGFLRDALFIWLASVKGWKVTAHLRGGEFDLFYSAQPRLARWLMRRVTARVDSMAVMGTSLTHMFDGMIAPERIAVVPNGTPDIARGDHVRETDTVLFLSNLLARKGVVEAVAAAELVLQQHPTARFHFVGSWYDPALARSLEQRTRGVRDRLAFLPPVAGEAKRAALLSASILLFPPVLSEGHPRVVLEGLAAGLPVVTTDRGAIAETVVHGESGFVLADPVPEQLAEHILRLLEDDALRARMAAAARARYEALYSQEQADTRLADWLSQVAEDRADPKAAR